MAFQHAMSWSPDTNKQRVRGRGRKPQDLEAIDDELCSALKRVHTSGGTDRTAEAQDREWLLDFVVERGHAEDMEDEEKKDLQLILNFCMEKGLLNRARSEGNLRLSMDEDLLKVTVKYHQVGGHDNNNAIFFEEDRVLKRMQGSGRGQRENAFLEKASKHPFLSHKVPIFYGIVERENGAKYISLQNVLHGFEQPAVLDLKIGTQTWDAHMSWINTKRKKVLDLMTTAPKLGVQVVGGRIPAKARPDRLTKVGAKFQRSIGNEVELEDLLHCFLKNEALLKSFHEQIRELYMWFCEQTEFTFTASSLLVAYDHKDESASELRMYMIDFAHTYAEHVENGYRIGLETLMRVTGLSHDMPSIDTAVDNRIRNGEVMEA